MRRLLFKLPARNCLAILSPIFNQIRITSSTHHASSHGGLRMNIRCRASPKLSSLGDCTLSAGNAASFHRQLLESFRPIALPGALQLRIPQPHTPLRKSVSAPRATPTPRADILLVLIGRIDQYQPRGAAVAVQGFQCSKSSAGLHQHLRAITGKFSCKSSLSVGCNSEQPHPVSLAQQCQRDQR